MINDDDDIIEGDGERENEVGDEGEFGILFHCHGDL
jgi:hypothetical protein